MECFYPFAIIFSIVCMTWLSLDGDGSKIKTDDKWREPGDV